MTDACASLDLRENGHILNVFWDVWTTGTTAQVQMAQFELSFSSVNALVSNDTATALSSVSVPGSCLISPSFDGQSVAANHMLGGIDYGAGERLYLHAKETLNAVTQWSATCYITVEEGSRGGDRDNRGRFLRR